MIDFFDANRPSSDEVIQMLTGLKSNDLPWQNGKVMAYVYEPEPEAYALIKKAYTMFLTENGLDPTAFSSLLHMEKEVIDIALQILGGDENSAGNFTFGGTESIMLAVKAARDYAREKNPHISQPNIVLPVTAHAAFFKACHYLCVEIKLVEVDPDSFTPRASDFETQIDENTILLVASAPSYAHGVMDPIEDIAALARRRDLLFHVDACVGGMYLPFAKRAGFEVPPFDFSVPGVTSISMDFHKYGYTAKGASCILHKHKDIRKFQIYTCSQWSGYSVVNATVLSSKTGGSLAACWANLHYLGSKGYEEIVRKTQSAKQDVEAAIERNSSLKLLGKPVMNMVAFASEDIDLFALASLMKERGWYIQLQFRNGVSPTNIHLSINRANVDHIPDFINELEECVGQLAGQNLKIEMPFPIEMLEMLTPEMVNQLKEGLGISDGEAPKDLTLVNRILDAASPNIRDMIIREFMNGLFR
ncbi:MAG: aspartate aminotransferase family protein [Bacteroidota bacterium]